MSDNKIICLDNTCYVAGLPNVGVGEVYEVMNQFHCQHCGKLYVDVGHNLPTSYQGLSGVTYARCVCGHVYQTAVRWYSYESFSDYDLWMENELEKLLK